MAVFKRVDYQQVYSFQAVKASGSGEFEVGSLISRNAANNEISVITSLEDAKQAKDDGMELYIISQSDAVTYKTGKEYQTYKMSREIEVSSDAQNPSIVAGYRVDNLDNIEL